VQLIRYNAQDMFVFLVQNEWSYNEMSALVEYIALYHAPVESSSKAWPAHKNDEFWGACADAVNSVGNGNNRTGE
jgi:hypothetical protein